MLIAAVIAGIAALIIVRKSTIVVPPRSTWMISRLGKPHGVRHAGMHVLVPVIDVVAQKYSLDEQQVAVADTYRSSNDERVHVEAKVRYRVLDPKTAFDKVADLDATIRNAVGVAIRRETESRTVSFIRDDRRAFRDAILRTADKIVAEFGVKLVDLAIELPRGF
jgi:regulator of protease activity HflC (stomatin/prohibitin superfamily)